MASRKSRFDHLLFLQKVNECTFLYDINDANYKDMMLKEARWTEIGAAFQMTGQVAQLKWKSLRDRFTREKKKYEDLRKNTEEEVPPPKWWLFSIIGKMLDRSSDSSLSISNGDGYEEKDGVYEQADIKQYTLKSSGDDRSPFAKYHNNNKTNHHHLRNHRHSNNNNNNNNAETSRSSMCSVDHHESDSATPAEGDGAVTATTEISSAVHCEVHLEDDDDDDDESQPSIGINPTQFQPQHNPQSYKRKRSHVEDTMTEWTYQLTNCLLQRIVEIYPPANNGIAPGVGPPVPEPNSMDDVEYYVRSLGPRLRRLKAKDRGLVRLKIETALYEIESAVDE